MSLKWWWNNMGLVKQSTQESYTKGMDVPSISPLVQELSTKIHAPVNHAPMNKDKRILVQGILQAVAQSQGLLLEPGGTWEERVENSTKRFVKFVEEQSQ